MTERKTRARRSTSRKKTSAETANELVSVNLHAKYRPRVLEDFIGQESESKTVAGWFKSGRIPSSIMITGLTGSGKTTFARMIGMYANCATLDACGKCASCKAAIDANYKHPDVHEYNMGEVGGKADILNVIEASKFRPRYRKRVLLIDEAHLATAAAESALLVPTEEPLAQTIWIFCTSEKSKIKQTLVNRCAQLTIKPIEPKLMVPRLTKIIRNEGIKVTSQSKAGIQSALRLVAERSEGQMRFAISKLDNLISRSLAGEKFNKELVESDYSNSGDAAIDDVVVDLMKSIVENDLLGAITALRQTEDARGVLHKTRFLITSIIGDATKTNKWQSAQLKKFKATKTKYTLPTMIFAQNALVQAEMLMNTTSVPEAVIMETELGKLIAHDYFNQE